MNDAPTARAATLADLPEILRLVEAVYEDMHRVYGGAAPQLDENWRARVTAALDRRLGQDAAVFVVDGASGTLASIAAGFVFESLPSPRRAHLLEGHVQWVATDANYRGRGYATAVTSQLLEWFRSHDALTVSLNSSPEAESLYMRLGFSDKGPRALSIRLE